MACVHCVAQAYRRMETPGLHQGAEVNRNPFRWMDTEDEWSLPFRSGAEACAGLLRSSCSPGLSLALSVEWGSFPVPLK